jgi:ParB-like chromosome segregation protein Spo0J
MTNSSPQIVMAAVDDLIPYASNARVHSDAQIAQIAASIREFGWTNPLLIDAENNLIAGHGRLMAARKLNLQTVPVIVMSHLTTSQRKALVIADNKIGLNSGWDDELLAAELQGLSDGDFELGLIGFDADELSKLLGLDNLIDEPNNEEDIVSVFEVAVSCSNESEQETIFQMMTAKGYKCRVLTM